MTALISFMFGGWLGACITVYILIRTSVLSLSEGAIGPWYKTLISDIRDAIFYGTIGAIHLPIDFTKWVMKRIGIS